MESCRKLDMYESNELLLSQAQKGDRESLNRFAQNNIGLVAFCCKKFLNKGYEYDDLFQIGSIGLTKAINKFNPEFNVRFATYAVPMIVGEIKRFIRDDTKVRRKDKKEHNAGNVFISINETVYQGSSGEPITYVDILTDNNNTELEVLSRQIVNDTLNILTQRERDIVIRYFFNDMSQQQIADLYQIGQVSVSRTLKSSKAKMRAYYEGGRN